MYEIPKTRPVMTTGLETANNERPIIGREDDDPQRDFIYTTSLENEFDQLNARGQRLWEIREQYEKPLKAKVLDFVRRLAMAGYDINIEAVEERLQKDQFIVVDTDSEHINRFKLSDDEIDFSAHHIPKWRLSAVHITEDDFDLQDEHAGIHEFFHAASRQIFVTRAGSVSSDHFPTSGLVPGGLEITDEHEPAHQMEQIGRALNEAVTEHLTMVLTQERGNIVGRTGERGHYLDERKLLEKILEVGEIKMQVFVEAYFEEPDLDAALGQRMPKWHRLVKKLDSKFGPRFLHRIDAYLRQDPNNIKRLTGEIPDNYHQLYHMRADWEKQKARADVKFADLQK